MPRSPVIQRILNGGEHAKRTAHARGGGVRIKDGVSDEHLAVAGSLTGRGRREELRRSIDHIGDIDAGDLRRGSAT